MAADWSLAWRYFRKNKKTFLSGQWYWHWLAFYFSSPWIALYPCVLCVLQLKRHIQYSSTLTNMRFSQPSTTVLWTFRLFACLIYKLLISLSESTSASVLTSQTLFISKSMSTSVSPSISSSTSGEFANKSTFKVVVLVRASKKVKLL